jgi:hypothetical protein
MGSQNYLYTNGNSLGKAFTAWESKNFSIDPSYPYIYVAHFSNILHKDKNTGASDPQIKLSYKDGSWKDLSSQFYIIPRDTTSSDESISADKWQEFSYLIYPENNNMNLKISDNAYKNGSWGDDLAISGIGLYRCSPMKDFGDAMLGYSHPSQAVSKSQNVFIGDSVDGETMAYVSDNASGDDNNATDDEDGVTSAQTLVAGQPYALNLKVTNKFQDGGDYWSKVYAWIDFNGDKIFQIEEANTDDILVNEGEINKASL